MEVGGVVIDVGREDDGGDEDEEIKSYGYGVVKVEVGYVSRDRDWRRRRRKEGGCGGWYLMVKKEVRVMWFERWK